MTLDGAPYAPGGPAEAERAGLRVVHQELNLVPGFTAYENAFVGRPYPRRAGIVDWRAMRGRFDAVRQRHGLVLDIDAPVHRLSAAKCQIAEILRALMDEARVMVLDEPTASLSAAEADTLHRVVHRLAAHGCAVIYVSHRLEEVFAVAQDFTVLRNGEAVGSGALSEVDRDRIVALMAGEALHRARPGAAPAAGAPVLEIERFAATPGRPPIDLRLRAGEIVGLYGVVGSGRSSLLRAVWGAARAPHGTVRVDGTALASGIAARIAAGVAYVPEDRRTAGLVMHHSILDNALLPRLPHHRAVPRLPVIAWRSARRHVLAMLSARGVRFRRLDDRIATLSGGNQQKVMIGRWLRPGTRVFLLDEPTRGVDVRSKAQIHALCRRLAGEGAAVLFVTSDMEELFDLAARVIVLAQGRVTLDAPAGSVGRQPVVDAAFAGSRHAAGTAR